LVVRAGSVKQPARAAACRSAMAAWRRRRARPIPGVIPRRADRAPRHGLTCVLQTPRYPDARSLAFGSAGCEDRQGRIGLDVKPLPVSHHVVDRILVPSTGSSAENVTGGRKLARHDSLLLRRSVAHCPFATLLYAARYALRHRLHEGQ